MDYLQWAQEYEDDAKRIKEVINKKRARAKTARNAEMVNKEINTLENIYLDLLGTANQLRRRAEGGEKR
ncbi:MAG: hypothetical protein ACI4HO_08845 [Ruminococcus sp.]